jgi:hypothetical protein
MLRFLLLAVYIISFVTIQSCTVSLKGVTIPPDVNTFHVENFVMTADLAPPDLNQRFSEALRNKIRNESRLILKEVDPDIFITGVIKDYKITPENISADQNTAALNRFEITIDVVLEYTNKPDAGWKNKTYVFFRTFESSVDFQNVQETLTREIFDLFTEQIFNDAFSQW